MNILEKLYDIIKIIKINPRESMTRSICVGDGYAFIYFDNSTTTNNVKSIKYVTMTGSFQVSHNYIDNNIKFRFKVNPNHACLLTVDVVDLSKEIVELVLIYGRDIQLITDQKNIDIVDQCIHFLKYYGHI